MKMLTLMIFLFGVIGSGCSSKQLSKKSPDLAKDQRLYRLRPDKVGVIYHRKCKTVGTGMMGKRKCEETEFNLIDEWSFFAPTFFLGPYREYHP